MKKILSNKFFLLGNLLLLLLAIPVTLFFIRQQQDLQSRAAPSSRLYFAPESTSTSAQCSSFTVDIMVNPGQNIVSIVDFYLTYDPTLLDILEIKESTSFPTVVRPINITSGEANMSVSVGSDVTRAVQTTTSVATVTFRPKSAGAAQVQFDSTQTRVFSLAPDDEPTENVLSTTTPTNIGITDEACPDGEGDGTTPTPTLSPGPGTLTPTPTGGVGGGGGETPTPSPTTTDNQIPTCTDFTVSPASTGSAPFSVLFTAKGNDPDDGGVISKATFNFGDGQVEDVTEGMNLKDVTVQINHTYQNPGTFGATVTFTDDAGEISQSCSENITTTVSTPSASPTGSASAATSTPTTAPTLAEKPTAAPTIPPTGGLIQTVGIAGVVLLVIVGGFVLLTL